MRDALSLTDQAIAYGEGKLVGGEVAEMLGTVDRGQVLELVAAILDEDPAAVLALVAQIAEHAPDFVSTLDELSSDLASDDDRPDGRRARSIPAGPIRRVLSSWRLAPRWTIPSCFGKWRCRVAGKCI